MLTLQLKGPVMRRLSDMQAFVAPQATRKPPAAQPAANRQWAVDIANRSGMVARGIEITIEGLSGDDVFRAFYLSRSGTPRVLHTERNSIIVRFESQWNANLLEVNQVCREQTAKSGGQKNFLWDICLYGEHGPERCGLELSTINVTASYRWLPAETGDHVRQTPAPDMVWVPAF